MPVASSSTVVVRGSSKLRGVWGVDRDYRETAGEVILGMLPPVPLYMPVLAGAQLWARIQASHTENRGVIIYAGD